MTAQASDKLINRHSLDLGQLAPFGFRCEGKYSDRCLPVQPNPALRADWTMLTSLLRGYIATLLLRTDGQLELVQFEYPSDSDHFMVDPINELFSGDFELCLAHFFGGPETLLPFRNGQVVTDRNEWEVENQTVEILLKSVLRDESGEVRGVRVDSNCGAGWLPAALIPQCILGEIDEHLGRVIDSTIERIIEAKRVVCFSPVIKLDRQTGAHYFSDELQQSRRVGGHVCYICREELPYSPGKLLLLDSIVRHPSRIENTNWWLVIRNEQERFEVQYNLERRLFRTSKGENEWVELADATQVFNFLQLNKPTIDS